MNARALPLLIAVLAGCGGDSGTGPASLTSIEIQAPRALAAFMVNDSTHVSVIGRDRSGNIHFAGPVTWRSTNATVFSVDSLALIVGKAAGSAILIATVGELADSLAVTVAGTRHLWPIDVSETWSLAGSPHLVDGRLDVSRASGGTAILTIEAGVTVIFTDTSGLTFGLNGPGLLRAMGTPTAPIILRDTATTAIPGAWVGLTFRSGDSSELHNVTLRGCGRSRLDGEAGCLVLGHYLFPPFLTVDNVTVERGAGGAVILSRKSHFAAGSSGLTVRNMRGHIATLPASEAPAFPTASTFSTNDTAEVRLLGDTLRDSASWSPSIPWVVMGPVYIEGTRQPVLTIPAGITLPFDFGASLVVGKNAPGELRVGTGGGPTTTLRARRADWAGVSFWPAAKPGAISNAVLENCGNYSDTGYGYACVSFIGNFYGSAPAPVLTDVTIRGATGFGVAAVGGGRFGDGSASVTITGSRSFGSPGAPLSFFETSPASIPSGSYTGNATDTIYVTRNEVTRTETWRNHGVPYLIREGLGIGHAVNPILTLEPGVELRFTPGGLLSVAWLATGGVRAIGTAAEPIVITGQYGPGSWGGAVVGVYADSSTLFEHVVMDGGAFEVRRDIGPVIRNTLTKNSGGCAITRVSGSPWLTDFTAPALGNTFQDNVGPDQCGP